MPRQFSIVLLLLLLWRTFFPAPAVAVTLEQSFNKSYALVVGIDEYPSTEWPDLRYAVRDARAMADFFRSQKFIVHSLFNDQATRVNILDYLEDNLATIAGGNDRLVFFFAGHGHTKYFSKNKTRGYIVPYDGGSTTASLLSMERIRDISDIFENVRHQLFIMDSCYGGRLGTRRSGKVGVLDPDIPGYLEEVVKRKARQILTAGGADQQVQDGGASGHSLFTGELLKALRDGQGDTNGDGYISFYELATYIQLAASRPNQTPGIDFLDGHEQGEFLFRNLKFPGTTENSEGSTQNDATGQTRGKSVFELVQEGKQKFNKGDKKGALPFFQQAAKQGNVEARFYQGVVLNQLSSSSAEDRKMGFQLIEQAAELGQIQALNTLIKYYSGPMHYDVRKKRYWQKKLETAEKLTADLFALNDPSGTVKKDDSQQALSLSPPQGFRIEFK